MKSNFYNTTLGIGIYSFEKFLQIIIKSYIHILILVIFTRVTSIIRIILLNTYKVIEIVVNRFSHFIYYINLIRNNYV